MRFYKFRPLLTYKNFKRVKDIFFQGFYCSNFLDFNDINEGVYPISENFSLTLKEKLEYKICSFSKHEALESQLMWGHYAGSGMGIVIEAEIDKEKLKEVNYHGPGNYETTLDVLTNKNSDWEYEKEYRFISETENKFFKPEITKILFGAPYEGLVNYSAIKSEHKNLQKYLQYSQELQLIAMDKKIPHVKFHLSSHA